MAAQPQVPKLALQQSLSGSAALAVKKHAADAREQAEDPLGASGGTGRTAASDPSHTARGGAQAALAAPTHAAVTAPAPTACGALFRLLFPCMAPPPPPGLASPQHTPCLLFGTSARRNEVLRAKGAPHAFSSELSLYERAQRSPRGALPSCLSDYPTPTPSAAASAAARTPATGAASSHHFAWPAGFVAREPSPLPAAGGLQPKASFFVAPK